MRKVSAPTFQLTRSLLDIGMLMCRGAFIVCYENEMKTVFGYLDPDIHWFFSVPPGLFWCSISSPNIIRVIKSRRLRWAGHVARMGRGEVHTGL
jgi:hypothetical protein